MEKQMMTTDKTETRKTVNVETAAEIVGISRNAMYQAIQRGEVPSIKLGKRILVPLAALEKFLDVSARTKSEPADPRVAVNISIPLSLKNRLENEADRHQWSLTYEIISLLQQSLSGGNQNDDSD